MGQESVKKYQIIYADPPWSYDDKMVGNNIGALAHYHTMTIAELCKLNVQEISAENAVLFLWVTSPKLNECWPVITAWGFTYKTVVFCWNKITSEGKWVANMGRWTMGNIELCLLGTKGQPHRITKNVRQQVIAPRTIHSKKPAEVRKKIIRLMGDLPRIELFARKENLLFDADNFDGWDVWGNEVKSDIEL